MTTISTLKEKYQTHINLLKNLHLGAIQLGATGTAKELMEKIKLLDKVLFDLNKLPDSDAEPVRILNPTKCFELYTYLSTNNTLTKNETIKKIHDLFELTDTPNLTDAKFPAADSKDSFDPFELYSFLYPLIQLDFERFRS